MIDEKEDPVTDIRVFNSGNGAVHVDDGRVVGGGQWAVVKRTAFVKGLLDNGALLVKDATPSDDAPESPTVDTTTTDAPPTTISKRRRKASPSAKE